MLTHKINRSPDAAVEGAPVEETETVNFRGVPVLSRLFEDSRGRAKGKARCRPVYDLTVPDPFLTLRKAIGVENFNRLVIDGINDLFDDAADDSRTPEGKIDLKLLPEKLAENAQRGGSKTGIKELRRQHEKVSFELGPLMAKKIEGVPLSPTEIPEFARLYATWKELTHKLEGKQRAEKTPAKVKK